LNSSVNYVAKAVQKGLFPIIVLLGGAKNLPPIVTFRRSFTAFRMTDRTLQDSLAGGSSRSREGVLNGKGSGLSENKRSVALF